MNNLARAWNFCGLALLLALTACGAPPELPPAKPLSADAQHYATLPGYGPGPFAVQRSPILSWHPAGGDEYEVRGVYPELSARKSEQLPLLVFSHGFASDVTEYDALLEHWASHGVVTLAIRHPDAGGTLRGIWSSIRLGKEGLISARTAALHRLIDERDSLPGMLQEALRHTDPSAIIAAGHSFGAFTAQQLGGAVAISPQGDRRLEARHGAVTRVIAISPPGEMFGWIQADSWSDMQVPQLVTTGTWDVDGRFVTDWRQHRLSFDSAPAEIPGALLVVQGADHYLGNLICRTDRDVAPQTDALRFVQTISLQFLRELDFMTLYAADPLSRRTQEFATLETR